MDLHQIEPQAPLLVMALKQKWPKLTQIIFISVLRGTVTCQISLLPGIICKIRRSEKTSRGIHLEFPKNPTWPNLSIPTTRKVRGTKPPKSLLLGSSPFTKLLKNEKWSRDIHLKSPKNLAWPNLNKSRTGKFGGSPSHQKSEFLGSGPFSEA